MTPITLSGSSSNVLEAVEVLVMPVSDGERKAGMGMSHCDRQAALAVLGAAPKSLGDVAGMSSHTGTPQCVGDIPGAGMGTG